MKHPAKGGKFKVVIQNGFFSVTEVQDSRFVETRASITERQRLVALVGLYKGDLPGLVESYARRMARRMGAGRKGQRRGRRGRRA